MEYAESHASRNRKRVGTRHMPDTMPPHWTHEVTIVDHVRVVLHRAGALSMRPRARVMQRGAVGVSYEQLVVAGWHLQA